MADRAPTLGGALADCVDKYKGLLMLVVVLDHNDFAHTLFPAAFRPLTFHVIGFLLLPFVIGNPKWTRTFVLDRVVRYGVPQFWTLTVAALLYWLILGQGVTMQAALADYLAALAIGSGPLVKQSSGFLAYWFLPTFLGLSAVLAGYRGLSSGGRKAMGAAFVVAHGVLVAAWCPWYAYVPFGLAIAANVFVLGLVFAWLCREPRAYVWRWLAIPSFLVSYGWLMHRGTFLKLPLLEMAPVANPLVFIAQDVAALSGAVVVLLVARALAGSAAIASIGRLSLVIYLAHPLCYAAVDLGRHAAGLNPLREVSQLAVGALEYAIALGASWLCAKVIAGWRPLGEWITPRGWAAWPPTALVRGGRILW